MTIVTVVVEPLSHLNTSLLLLIASTSKIEFLFDILYFITLTLSFRTSRPIGMEVFINSLTLSGKGFPNKTAVVGKVKAVKVHELYKVLTIPYKPQPGQLPNV